MKIITICGSLKYVEQMKVESERLELEGNCVLGVVYPTKDKDTYTNHQCEILNAMHKVKINMSDAIFVVNVGGYIGNSTKSEIEYAKELGKEILFLED